MNLKAYVQSLTPAQKRVYADRVGIKRVYLKQLCSGFRRPGPVVARRLHTESGFQVALHELRPDLWDREQAA